MFKKLVLMSIAALSIQACSTPPPLNLSTQAINVINNPENPLSSSATPDAIMLHMSAKTAEGLNQKAIANALMMRSDRLCENYMTKVLTQSRGWSSGLKIGSIFGLATATTTAHVETKNQITGLAGFASNSEETLKNNIFNAKAPELIYKAVMSERDAKRAELNILLNAEDTSKDAAYIVMSRLEDYHATCGITVGINALSKALDASSPKTKENAENNAKSLNLKLLAK